MKPKLLTILFLLLVNACGTCHDTSCGESAQLSTQPDSGCRTVINERIGGVHIKNGVICGDNAISTEEIPYDDTVYPTSEPLWPGFRSRNGEEFPEVTPIDGTKVDRYPVPSAPPFGRRDAGVTDAYPDVH